MALRVTRQNIELLVSGDTPEVWVTRQYIQVLCKEGNWLTSTINLSQESTENSIRNINAFSPPINLVQKAEYIHIKDSGIMQPRRKETRMVRKVIYRLKRDYGFSLTIYKIIDTDLNLKTGKKRRIIKFKKINKAVLLPSRMFRAFVYDLSYIAAAKNFTSGGFFDPNDRVILIDWQDTRDFEIEIDDYIIYDNHQYLVSEVREFEYRAAYLLKVREVKGSKILDVANQNMISTITFAQNVTGIIT